MSGWSSSFGDPSPDTIRVDLPASYTYLHVIGACITEMLGQVPDLPDVITLSQRVVLAVHEILVNIVDHAYVGQRDGRIAISVRIVYEPRWLMVELRDSGVAFDIDAIPEPDLDAPQVHGYGIFLARRLLDSVSYTSTPGENRWLLVKRV